MENLTKIEARPGCDGTVTLEIVMPAYGNCVAFVLRISQDDVNLINQAASESLRQKEELTKLFTRAIMNASSS